MSSIYCANYYYVLSHVEEKNECHSSSRVCWASTWFGSQTRRGRGIAWVDSDPQHDVQSTHSIM